MVNSNSVRFTVSQATGEPPWFTNLAERTWTDIAGGTAYAGADWQKGARLSDVAPSPLPPGSEGQVAIIQDWNGAAALQNRGEYLKICEGGHGGYYGNEIYALCLKDSTPGWKRIWGPTPNASINTANPPGSAYNTPYDVNFDNTPRSMHGWFRRLATEGGATGERLWTLATGANPAGVWTTDVWSIPRSALAAGVYDPSLWIYHGRSYQDVLSSDATSYLFTWQSGPNCFDSVGDAIMLAGEADARPSPGPGLWCKRINVSTCVGAGNQATSGPQCPGTTAYFATAGNPQPGFANSWSVVTYNTSPRCWIVGRPSAGNIAVWNLESPAGWRIKSVTGTLPNPGIYNGAVYHGGTRKILIGGAASSTVQWLSVPIDPWNGTNFAMGALTTNGGSVVTRGIGTLAGTYSQFQMIEDMGNGQGCIVMHVSTPSYPTYVYKMPLTF